MGLRTCYRYFTRHDKHKIGMLDFGFRIADVGCEISDLSGLKKTDASGQTLRDTMYPGFTLQSSTVTAVESAS